jgi:hypothetical protein
MNRNVIIGLVVLVVVILGVMMFMPGSNEQTGDGLAPATPPASTETAPPATPAPAN